MALIPLRRFFPDRRKGRAVSHVRFTSKSGHQEALLGCPLCAKSRLVQCAQTATTRERAMRGPSIGPPSDLHQLGDFRAAVLSGLLLEKGHQASGGRVSGGLLYPQKRTLISTAVMSAKCQKKPLPN